MAEASCSKAMLGGAALCVLCACAPEGGTPTFVDRAVANGEAFSDLGSLPNATSLPVSGTARYSGGTEMRFFESTGQQFVLVGNADVAVDFGGATLSGAMTGFQGGVAVAGAPYPTAAADYAGRIDISNGSVGAAGPGSLGATFGGTLTGAGNVITANGGLLGDFKGNPVQGLVAVGGGVVTLNGAPATGLILNLWAQ